RGRAPRRGRRVRWSSGATAGGTRRRASRQRGRPRWRLRQVGRTRVPRGRSFAADAAAASEPSTVFLPSTTTTTLPCDLAQLLEESLAGVECAIGAVRAALS